MNLFRLLFSARGRATRSQFWLGQLVVYVIFFVVFAAVYMTGGGASLIAAANLPASDTVMMLATSLPMIALLLSTIALFYAIYALSIKRLHDRGKSGWWVWLMTLLSFVVIGSIWWLIELGFLGGTKGDNKYGPDPLAEKNQAMAPQAF